MPSPVYSTLRDLRRTSNMTLPPDYREFVMDALSAVPELRNAGRDLTPNSLAAAYRWAAEGLFDGFTDHPFVYDRSARCELITWIVMCAWSTQADRYGRAHRLLRQHVNARRSYPVLDPFSPATRCILDDRQDVPVGTQISDLIITPGVPHDRRA